ncbi:MAG: DHH family phosphoesterase [Halodesulfurarchaeum sp.]
MVSRLVLGCDTTVLSVIEHLETKPGDLLVIAGDEGRVEQLRNEKVAAEVGDVADRETLLESGVEPDVVYLMGPSPGMNLAAANLAADVFPDAYLLAFGGNDATPTDLRSLEEVADSVISRGALLLEYLDDMLVGGQLERLQGFRNALEEIDGRLGVFTHDNPDPDAIAAALGVVAIAEWFDVEAVPIYYGDISHQENRAFVNLLDLELRNATPEEEVDVDGVALVDHSAPGVNDQLPPDTEVDIVIDHHPPKTTVEANFVDIRESVGATSTLVVDYLEGYDVGVETAVATGLLFGIRIDTQDFVRGVTTQDFDAAAYLLPRADTEVLHRVESPSISPDTFETIAQAIRERETRGQILSSGVGGISDRDALAQAADRLLNMEDISVTFVFGYNEGTIYLSARSRGVEIDLGDVLRRAFGDIGSAGGHADMAGAQIPMGLFDEIDEEAETELSEMVEAVIAERLFSVLEPEELEE